MEKRFIFVPHNRPKGSFKVIDKKTSSVLIYGIDKKDAIEFCDEMNAKETGDKKNTEAQNA